MPETLSYVFVKFLLPQNNCFFLKFSDTGLLLADIYECTSYKFEAKVTIKMCIGNAPVRERRIEEARF